MLQSSKSLKPVPTFFGNNAKQGTSHQQSGYQPYNRRHLFHKSFINPIMTPTPIIANIIISIVAIFIVITKSSNAILNKGRICQPTRWARCRSFAMLRMTLPSIFSDFSILQSLFNLYFFVSFNNITDLDIVTVCRRD